jgi:Na+-driven multidrug efflux pump
VVLLTGIAGHLGREAAIGYAMGARLEYILIPLGLGFGTAINAMVGTNWGAKQYRRAHRIAWTGAATVAGTCAMIGLVVALFPRLWMGLFSQDESIIQLGAAYLLLVGPIYGCYGLGMGLFSATQGFGNVVGTVTANAMRLLVSAGGGLIAISWLGLGPTGFFAAIALGFVIYAALSALAVLRVQHSLPKSPASSRSQPTSKGEMSHVPVSLIHFAGR